MHDGVYIDSAVKPRYEVSSSCSNAATETEILLRGILAIVLGDIYFTYFINPTKDPYTSIYTTARNKQATNNR